MSERLHVRPTRRASQQIQEADAWWEKNRLAAPGAVREELEQAFALLSAQPGVGARARNARLRGVRRIHLSRIGYYLYYRVKRSVVEVLAFWHASRGSGPRV
ncbi:MAG: type II toxin-antitoxin system RelE/ParE family toxin [Candidatus Binatia bacterium]